MPVERDTLYRVLKVHDQGDARLLPRSPRSSPPATRSHRVRQGFGAPCRKLRAAAVSFLNAHPLTAGSRAPTGSSSLLAELAARSPMLEDGEVDLALVSVAALTKGEYEIVPGHRHRRRRAGADRGPRRRAVARDLGRGRSSTPPRAPRTSSRSSCSTRWAFTPVHADARGREGLARAKGTKGALVIGDRGFGVRANHVLDLGREWTHLTGLPMIFALWAARPGRVSPEDVQELTRAAQHGLGVRTELAQRFAAQKGGDPERYRRYLTQRIRYGPGPHELDGLEAFLGRRARKGFLPPMKLRFVDDVVRTRRARRAGVARHRAAEGRRRRAARRGRGGAARREGAAPRARARRRRRAAARSTPTAWSPTSSRAT